MSGGRRRSSRHGSNTFAATLFLTWRGSFEGYGTCHPKLGHSGWGRQFGPILKTCQSVCLLIVECPRLELLKKPQGTNLTDATLVPRRCKILWTRSHTQDSHRLVSCGAVEEPEDRPRKSSSSLAVRCRPRLWACAKGVAPSRSLA